MSVAIVTGSAGLIGSETVRFFAAKGFDVVGIDNNLRKTFFGEDASTHWNRQRLEESIKSYTHYDADIRDHDAINKIYARYGKDVKAVIHCAAQPSHDWAASDPYMDFTVNANGTLVMLENFRQNCPEAVFIFTSTNKVYGDTPNFLPLVELDKRFEIAAGHKWEQGIDETMSIDQTKHSLFGASKVAADVLVQEYGRYFGLNTGGLPGRLPDRSGPLRHQAARVFVVPHALLHHRQQVFHLRLQGQAGPRQHSLLRPGELPVALLREAPGGRSVQHGRRALLPTAPLAEAIDFCQEISGKEMNYEYQEDNRIGDHIWWISGLKKFEEHYPRLEDHLRCAPHSARNPRRAKRRGQ